MKIFKSVTVLALVLLLAGCDSLFDERDHTWDGRELQFAPTEAGTYTDAITFESDSEEQRDYTVEVQFVAEQEAQDNTGTFVVAEDTDAVEGEHFELLTSDGQFTIPANTSFGEIEVRFFAEAFEPGETRTLVLELTDDGDVPPSENYNTFTINVTKEEPEEE